MQPPSDLPPPTRAPAAESLFDRRRFERARAARRLTLGDPLFTLAQTTSTNDLALEAARRGAPHGTTYVADVQSQGRGRHGHRWLSPPGDNLLVSVVLRPSLDTTRAAASTLAVGLAVRDAVAPRLARPVRLKWPNDVWVDDRKLAGILVESQLVGDRLEAIVIGIGLNVAMREPPAELATLATSLAMLGDLDARREELLIEVLCCLERRFVQYCDAGIAPMLDELRAHDALAGRRVRVGHVVGTACGLDERGALLLRDDAGHDHPLDSGSVELL